MSQIKNCPVCITLYEFVVVDVQTTTSAFHKVV